MAHSLNTYLVVSSNESGNEWVEIGIVLVRLDSYWAPNASFSVWSKSLHDIGRVGYDAVVCVEMYEPWIVQIYNSSFGVPTTMAIVGKSATTDFEPDDGNRGPHLDSYTRVLNSTDKSTAFYVRYAGGFPFERY